MDIVFIGGIYTEEIEKYVYAKTKGPVQVAADTLQKNYLQGFIKTGRTSSLTVLNFPFVGSFPNYFNDHTFKISSKKESIFDKIDVYNYSFNTTKGIKYLSRCIKSFQALRERLNKNSIVICYSMHLSFLLSCFLYRLIIRKNQFYVIIPDLPEYMANRKGMSKVINHIISKLSYYIVNKSDGVSIITQQMASKFSPTLPNLVIEGISSLPFEHSNESVDLSVDELQDTRYFLYTGTLDSRYGIRDLITAYLEADIKDVKLVICGAGNEERYVKDISSKHPNIIYLGQIKREKSLFLQKKATLLINPRSNKDAFTAYSFPSKIIEYMMSGTPILMYRLHGIPEKYMGNFYEIQSYEHFVHQLKNLSELDCHKLLEMGRIAKNFIYTETNETMQANKFLTFIQTR